METQTQGSIDDPHSVHHRARVGFLWILSTTIVWQIASWILTLLTARILSPSDYGLLGLSEALVPYLLMATTMKLDLWLVQERELTEEKREAVFTLLLILGAITTVLGLIGAPMVAKIYNEPRIELPLQLTSFVFILRAIQVMPESVLRREMQFKALGLANLSIGIARGVLQVVLALCGFAYWSLVIGSVSREIAMAGWLVKRGGLPKTPKWNREICRTAFKFGFSATVAVVFWIIFSTADNLVVGKLFGVDVLGLYAMAFFLIDLPLSKLNTVVSPVVSPYYAKLKDNLAELRDAYLRITKSILLIISPVLMGMFATADDLVSVILGAKWAPMAPILRVMSVVGILRALTTNIYPVLYALGKPNVVLRASGFTAVVLPLCFYILGKHLGLNGIYLTWLAIFPLAGVSVLLLAVMSHLELNALRIARNVAPGIICSVIMAGVVSAVGWSLVELPQLLRLLSMIAAGAISYPAILWLGFRQDFSECVSTLKSLKKRG